MLALALTLSLCSGQLGAVPRSAHLLEDSVLAQAPAAINLEPGVSSAQLEVDLKALKRLRPSIGGGIALLVSGLSASAAGGLYMALGLGLSSVSGLGVIAIMGGAVLAIGLAASMLGLWLIITRGAERELVDNEMARLKAQLEMQRGAPQEKRGPAVPPPPPFPQASVLPALEVARF